MVDPQSARDDSARITLTPDMRPLADNEAARQSDEMAADRSDARSNKARGRGALILACLSLIIAAGGLAASAWLYQEGQKEVLRLSTELAQLRVSLDLYAKSGGNSAALNDLAARLSSLEEAATAPASTLPDISPPGAATAARGPSEDCLPVGMRLLVAAGDSYPICEQPASVSVNAVDNGFITLSDGTSVASGGTMPLPGNPACTIAVTSAGDEGLTGYAEIRVSC